MVLVRVISGLVPRLPTALEGMDPSTCYHVSNVTVDQSSEPGV